MNRNQQPEEQKPLIAQAVEARYNAENLPQEYVGNPLTEALPGIISHEAVVTAAGGFPVSPTLLRTRRYLLESVAMG